MRYFKTLGIYKSSNVMFNPKTLESTSYNWWNVTLKIGNKLVFNNYSYSNSTAKHQSKIRAVLSELGIKIDYYVQAPQGLKNLDSAINYYKNRITLLTNEMNKPRSHKAKNIERKAAIKNYKNDIKLVEKLDKQYSKQLLREA